MADDLNSYFADLKIQQDKTDAVAATVQEATKFNPDQMAQYNRLAAVTQLDPLHMAQDPELRLMAEQRANLHTMNLDTLVGTHPYTANALSDLGTASLTHDDIPAMKRVEDAFGYYTKGAAALTSSVPYSLSGGIGLLRTANDVLLKPYESIVGADQVVNSWLTRLQTSMNKATEALTPQASGDVEAGVYSGLQSLGQNALAIGASVLTGGSAGILNRALGFMVAPYAGVEYGKAKDMGKSTAVAASYAASQASVELLTELGPTGALLKGAKLGSGFFTTLLRNSPAFVLKEIGGEQVATHWQDLNEWAVLHPEKTLQDYLVARPSAAIQTLVATLVASGGIVGTSKVMQKISGESVKAQNATDTYNNLSELSQSAAAAKLRERGVDRFNAFTQVMAEDGNVAHLYVDGKVLQDSLMQLPAEEQQRVLRAIPDLASQISEATATDSTVRISTADYATSIAGTPLDAAVLPNAKIDPEGYSYAQAQEHYAQQATEMQQAAQKIEQEQSQNQAYQIEVQQVHEEILKQITDTGHYRPEAAARMADLRKAWYVTRSADLGMKPSELYKQFPAITVGVEQIQAGAFAQGEANPFAKSADVKDAARAEGFTAAQEGSKRSANPYTPMVMGGKKKGHLKGKALAAQVAKAALWDEGFSRAGPQAVFQQASSNYGYRARDAARVATPDDLSPAKVKDLLRKTDWTILTAENPSAKQLTPEENAIRMAQLKADLDAQGLSYKEVKGKYGGNEENSLAIFGVTREQASDIGQQYGQESVLTRDGLVYPDGTINPARKISAFTELPDNNYTRVPGTNAAFSVDINFDTRIPVKDLGRIGEVAVDATHFSKEQRASLSGRMYGTGIRGAEGRRLNEPGVDSRIKERISFYVDEGQGVFPEAGVGTVQHAFTLTNLYDGAKNPLKLSSADLNTFEAAVLDAGFDGYYIKGAFGRQGAAVMLGQATKGLQPDLPPEGVLHQEEGQPKGFFHPASFGTGLLKNADLSTYLHETGHFFLEAEATLAAQANAPQKIKDDFVKALNWMGVADVATWQAMSLEEKRPYHEKYARGFEAYLMEGKAPSAELRTSFQHFAAWLTHIYQTLRGLKVELSPEIRGVFDRMLASEDAITSMEQSRQYEALLIGGASEEEAQTYVALGEKATADAIAELQKRSVRDMRWVGNARDRAIRALQREARSRRKDTRAEVAAEVMAEPVNQARTLFRRGEMLNPITGEVEKVEGLFRLDRTALEEYLPKDDPALAASIQTALRGMTAEEGITLDAAAGVIGYNSGAELLHDLTTAENPRDKIEGITDQRMLERYGDLHDAGSIARAADDAIHNDARAKFMATGLKLLTKSPMPVAAIKRAAKNAAHSVIAAKRIDQLKPSQYTAAETKANKAAHAALVNDPAGVIRAQQAVLLNHQLARAAFEAQSEVETGVAHLNRLQRVSAQSNMRGDYLDQLNALLTRFDLRTSAKAMPAERVALREWLASKADELTAVQLEVPEWVLNEANRQSYKTLTVEEFRGLLDTVKGLELLARREESQYQAIRGMKFAEERKAIVDRIKEFNPEAFTLDGEPKGLSPKFVKTIADVMKDKTAAAAGELLNAETIINLLEGGEFGIVHESLFGRMSKASDQKATRIEAIHVALSPLFEQYSFLERRAFGTKDIGTEKIGLAITRENALAVALLHGNPEGRDRLSNYGWSPEFQQKIIDLLDERDVKFANGVWKLFDQSLWPDLEALNKRTRGNSPPKVEALPHQTQAGALSGGYFPLVYDTHLDQRAQHYDEMEGLKNLAGGSFGMTARTAQGTSTERKQNVTMRPRLDLGVMAEKVAETVHDLAFREAALDTYRLLKDIRMRNTLINVAGEPSYLALLTRVREIAAPPRNPSGPIERMMALARKNTIVNLMSGVSTALLNFTGFIPAAGKVNSGQLIKQIGMFYSPKMLDQYNMMTGMSEYMRNRSQSFDRDLQEEFKKYTMARRMTPLPDTGTFLALMATVDKGVSTPIWHAAFHDGMAKFENDQTQAVAYADHIVRQTQGSGRSVDMAKIMTGHGGWGQLKKLFTMFYSYYNSQLGMLVTSGAVNAQLAKTNPVLASARFTKDFMLVVALPALLTVAAHEAAGGGGDDEKKLIHRMIWGLVSYGTGMFPFIRDIAPVYAAMTTKDIPFYGFKMSPAQFYVEAPAKAVKSIADVANGTSDDKDLRNIIMGTSALAGLPGKLISDVATGTKAFGEGKAGPEAILLGPPPKK